MRARLLHAPGFTLVEVAVALAIVATALTAGMKATSLLSSHAERQSALLLAQTCAENQLIALRLARALPSMGDSRVPCEQAGRQFELEQSVYATPNPNFRRVQAQVMSQGLPVLEVSTIIGNN